MQKIFCIYGLPASGKTTQAEKLAKTFNFQQFGMGDRLRAEIESGSELGKQLKDCVTQGVLVSDELMGNVIRNSNIVSGENAGTIFDGFPRIISQAKMLEKIIDEAGLDFVGFFYLKVTPETAIKRIEERAKLTHREDDENPEAVKNRIDTFKKESIALIEFYKEKNKLIEIDGEMSIEEVYKEIEKYLR